MTAIIAASAVGYLLVGVAIARVLIWRVGALRVDEFAHDEPAIIGVALFWLLFLPCALLGGLIWALYRLAALPPTAVRRQRKLDRLTAEIRRLEAELGVGTDR